MGFEGKQVKGKKAKKGSNTKGNISKKITAQSGISNGNLETGARETVKNQRKGMKKQANMMKTRAQSVEEALCMKAVGRALDNQTQNHFLSPLSNGSANFTVTCDQMVSPSVKTWLSWHWETAEEEKVARRVSTSLKKLTPCAVDASSKSLNRDWGRGEHDEIFKAVFAGRKGSRRAFENGYDFPPPLSYKE